MSFRFTEEDFERYVKQAEHGGKHIWHHLEDRLEGILGVPFTTNPFIARGDRLRTLWIVPKETPRPAWVHQAMFYLARKIEGRDLTFGLSVECPGLEWAEQEGVDTDRDGMRLIQRLENSEEFRAKIDQFFSSSQWQIGIWTDDTTRRAQSSLELLDKIQQIPEQKYWATYVTQKISAEEAIAAGEEIVDVVMRAYRSILPLWFTLIPEADRQFIRTQRREDVNVWWVNQGDSYEFASREGFLWAPLENSQGYTVFHWELLSDVAPDDITVHYYDSAIRGISRAKDEAQLDIHPHDADSDQQEQGRLLEVEYFEFATPVPLDAVREDLLTLSIENAPFDKSGNLKQGYLWRFDREGLAVLREAYDGPWPSWAEIALPIQSLATADPSPTSLASVDLSSLLKRNLSARGLQYSDWQIATFYTALQTKGFVILSGISGTGKTKLAQAFAEMLPQPARSEAEARDDVIPITVQPYMLKYNRLIIPKHFTKLYEPPPRGELMQVELTFAEQRQTCRLKYADYESTNYIALYLKGDASSWFSQNFDVDDTVVLEPRSDEEGRLLGFHIGAPSDPAFQEEAAGPAPSNNLFIPVRTDWRDSKSLLGYYNPLTGTYEWTEFLRFLLQAARSYRRGDGVAWFIILDEMNLARVEYYFADLLSVLESGRDEDGWTRESLRLPYPADAEGDLPPTHVKVPPNLYVIGTVNVDETTHTFSPKVLDRAFTLELTEADFSGYPPTVSRDEEPALGASARHAIFTNFTHEGQFVRIDKTAIAKYVQETGEVRAHLQMLNEELRPYQLHFGYRIFDEIVAFLISSGGNDLYADRDTAFDAAVLMKVLPKFHGSRGKLEEPLKRVLAWCLSPEAPDFERIDTVLRKAETSNSAIRALDEEPYRYGRTAAKTCQMLWELYTTGFTSFS
jgi:hypothetical protein